MNRNDKRMIKGMFSLLMRTLLIIISQVQYHGKIKDQILETEYFSVINSQEHEFSDLMTELSDWINE